MSTKKTERNKYFKEYILKDIFLHKLHMYEVRLCIFLTSQKTTLKDMSYDEKMWCSASMRDYAKLDDAENNLIKLGLLNTDGTGVSLDGREFIESKSINVVECRSQRELFMRCLRYWYKGSNITYIKQEYIYSMLGTDNKTINKNIKRVKESTGLEIDIKKKNNMYVATFPKKKYKTPYVDYKEYLQSDHWKKVSREYRQKYGKCQLCGTTGKLNVHHNNYECLYNETDKDLIVLCEECHKKFHDKI